MKKFTIFIVLMLFLAGCGAKDTGVRGYSSTSSDGSYVNIHYSEDSFSEGTIETNKGTYRFSYASDGELSIIYPNDYLYSYKAINGAIMTGWPYEKTAEELGYMEGFILARHIEGASGSEVSTKKVPLITSLLLIAIGGWHIYSPKTAWRLSRRWLFKKAEPSDLILGVYCFEGFIIVFIGIMSLFS